MTNPDLAVPFVNPVIYRLRKVSLLLLGSLLACSCLLFPEPVQAGEFQFLHEHPGKFTATATASNVPQKKLDKGSAARYRQNLEKLRNLLAAQPVMKEPKGVDIIGYFRPLDNFPDARNIPAPGFGYLRFHFYHASPKDGKPIRICCTTDEISVSINDPLQGLELYSASGYPTKAFYEPQQAGEIDGFPIYRMGGGDEVLVMKRGTRPLWVPVTREEYVRAQLKQWEKTTEGMPSPEEFRRLTGMEMPVNTLTLEIIKRHRAALETMSAEERKMQARQLNWDAKEPSLAPVGSSEGRPLVRVNPAWFDPALPRTAFQLITFRFGYSGSMNPDRPGVTQHGDISPFRVWKSLHTSNWKEISNALTDR